MGSRKLTFFWRFKGTSDVLRARMGECKRMLSWVAESKRSSARFKGSSAVLRARMDKCRRMMSWVTKSKRSSDDLKDLQTFFEREWTNVCV